MIGAPGCGKSTWLKENNLNQFVLCADEIRLLYASPALMPNGKMGIVQKNVGKVWKTLFEILEQRMERGEFTIIDACPSKESDFSEYKKLAEKYRYRIYGVDFRSVPLEVCKKQNLMRDSYKHVPENVIENMYARFARHRVPNFVTIVKPEDFEKEVVFKDPMNLNEFSKVHIIGDIHSSWTPLNEFLKDGIQEDEFYIFVGDYFDRNNQAEEVYNFLKTSYMRKNVVLLEGNHERWVRMYAEGEEENIKSKDFLFDTKVQFDNFGADKAILRQISRKLSQVCYFTFGRGEYLACHGGIPQTGAFGLTAIAAKDFIDGVGKYEDAMEVAKAWEDLYRLTRFHLIHGHRNLDSLPMQVNSRVFNLEGKVEFGGELRILTIEKGEPMNKHTLVEIPNPSAFQKIVQLAEKQELTTNGASLLKFLSEAKGITFKIQPPPFSHISSFNFERDVFYKDKFDKIAEVPRGFFVNTGTGDVVCRGFKKFFNIGEIPNSEMSYLKTHFKYPLNVFTKYNGFLGLLGWDKTTERLFHTSKSASGSDFTVWFMQIFNEIANVGAIIHFMKDSNYCMAFEVIDPINDPHIIDYSASELVLLDIFEREVGNKKVPFEKLAPTSKLLGLTPKSRHCIIPDAEAFQSFFDKYSTDKSVKDIEGFVIEDMEGNMTKLKLPYYNFWKIMRRVKDTVAKGRQVNLSMLTTPESNLFYGWLKKQSREMLEKTDICTCRKLFEEQK
jgi:predicted kinase